MNDYLNTTDQVTAVPVEMTDRDTVTMRSKEYSEVVVRIAALIEEQVDLRQRDEKLCAEIASLRERRDDMANEIERRTGILPRQHSSTALAGSR